ncbi:MAG TPA: glucosaminidase domain-containing protein, partial [Acetobacteraceae bacterium]|nr:glucosaminidase domain-containing protein [Acetobacteraceae bacterium]
APPIFTSVGLGGVNAPGDVFVIQSLLNDRLPKPHALVPINGIATIGVTLAIEVYQAVVMHMTPTTGRVDPGSPTYYSLAARPLVEAAPPPSAGHFGEVPPAVAEAAEASRQRWSVPASVTLAQWAVESAWGASMPPGSNNPFGIKATAKQPSVESPTREVVNGETVTVNASFRVFDSIAQAFDDHGRLLATDPVYSAAMKQKDDPAAFADALTGVYATDPNYGFTLKWVMQNYGFSRYDH